MDVFLWGTLEEQTPEQGSELPTTVKSEEELAKFTVDEHLSDTERTVLFLNGGQIIQQRHAIANLPAVIKARGRPGWESVAGPLKAALNKLDTDCQVEAAEVFAYISKERLMPPADLQACLLPTIVRNINKEKSEEETEGWLHALFELVPMLDKESLRGEVVPMALSKGDMEDSSQSRVLCARILGAVALYMTKDEVEHSFFKRALKMCQDVDHHVRLSSCQQLAAIGRTAGKDAVTKTVLDELQELLKDEDLQVRAAAFTSLVQLLDLLPADVRRMRVIPLLRDHVMPFDMDASMLRCVAKHFGQMIAVIKGDLEQDDPQLFYGCYRHLACKPDVELRRSCAQQVAQLVKAAASVQSSAYMQHFSETFQAFATDYDEDVRLAAANALHEVARYTGKDYVCQLLTRPLVQLLRDDSGKVQAAVLTHLVPSLAHFVADSSKQKQAAIDEIVRALLDLEAGSARNWRLQAALAGCFTSFHQFFTSDQTYEHFMPMAFRLLTSSAAAARPVVAEGLVCFLRYNKKDKQRAEVFLHLIRDFARGKCYTQRIAFTEVCKHMVQRFSAKFIKEWVFDLCLELLYDPVPNVRLQVTHILPTLKRTVRLPEDVDLLERLNNAISNSMTDNDRDVSQTARHINDTYKRMPVRMGGSSGSLVDASGGAQAVFEAEDKKKEAEEVDYTFSPEDMKEIKAEIVQMSYKKKPGAAGADQGAAPKSAINRRTDAVKAGPNAVTLRAANSGHLSAGQKLTAGAASTALAASAGQKPQASTAAAASRATGASASTSASSVAGSRAGSLASQPPSSSQPTSLGGKPAPASSTTSAVSTLRKTEPASKPPVVSASSTSIGVGKAAAAAGRVAGAAVTSSTASSNKSGPASTTAAKPALARVSGGAPRAAPTAVPVRKGSK